MGKKIGRNDPCWCGSGKKYKKCHLGKEGKDELNIHNVNTIFTKAMTKKSCLHPDAPDGCSKKIIRSHTISKSHFSSITREGKVYAYNYSNLYMVDEVAGQVVPSLVGANQATVFYGFCSKHDKELFAPIEDTGFEPEIKSCVIAAFRGFSKQYFDKLRSVNAFCVGKELLDNGRSEEEQKEIQQLLSGQLAAVKQDVEQLENEKELFSTAIANNSYDDFSFYCVELNKPPSLMVTGYFAMELDCKGNQIQDTFTEVLKVDTRDGSIEMQDVLKDEIHMVSACYLSSKGRNFAAFCWHKDGNDVYGKIFKTLHETKQSRISDALMFMVLLSCENVILSPEWWEDLADEKKELVNSLAHPTAGVKNPPVAINEFLDSDEPFFDDWEPIKHYSNLLEVE